LILAPPEPIDDHMGRLMGKLLILLAVLLMPFGMMPAPAAAAAHHGPMAGTPMQHCPGEPTKHDPKSGFVECTMACSAALPAADIARGEPLLIVCTPVRPSVSHVLHGLHPETATPPPRDS
jgi:hypothetical protein